MRLRYNQIWPFLYYIVVAFIFVFLILRKKSIEKTNYFLQCVYDCYFYITPLNFHSARMQPKHFFPYIPFFLLFCFCYVEKWKDISLLSALIWFLLQFCSCNAQTSTIIRFTLTSFDYRQLFTIILFGMLYQLKKSAYHTSDCYCCSSDEAIINTRANVTILMIEIRITHLSDLICLKNEHQKKRKWYFYAGKFKWCSQWPSTHNSDGSSHFTVLAVFFQYETRHLITSTTSSPP